MKPYPPPIKPYPPPIKPGFYWAKLVHPTRMPPNEDWASTDWEPVEVIVNDQSDNVSPEHLGVFVLGVSPLQWIEDFIWGPQVVRGF